MNIDKAWRKGYSGKGVTVAVIDTQTQTDHKDLVENMVSSLSVIIYTHCLVSHGTLEIL